MANTGFKWGAWDFIHLTGGTTDWDSQALNDDAGQLSAALSLDQKATFQLGFEFVEDNTGAINGYVTIAILRATKNGYEDAPGLANAQVGSPYKYQILPVQNDTVYISDAFSVAQFGPDPCVYVLNESGQQLSIDVAVRTCDVPVASA